MNEYIKRRSAFRIILQMLSEHAKAVKEWMWTPVTNVQKGRIAYKIYMQEQHMRRVKEKMPTLYREAVEAYMSPTWICTQCTQPFNFSVYGL